jgi:hypothetical protein
MGNSDNNDRRTDGDNAGMVGDARTNQPVGYVPPPQPAYTPPSPLPQQAPPAYPPWLIVLFVILGLMVVCVAVVVLTGVLSFTHIR